MVNIINDKQIVMKYVIKYFLVILFVNFMNTSGYSQVRQFNAAELRVRAESTAQGTRSVTLTDMALRIGSKVPDFEMNKIFNYSGGKAKFSDFKGKYIILDFWARNCASCLQGFPSMEKLQEKYKDKIQILAVCTKGTLEEYDLFEPGFPYKSKSHVIATTILPLVFNSRELVDFFPHLGEPYLVLINPEGKIIAMTNHKEVNEISIGELLAGKKIDFSLSTSFSNLLNSSASYDSSFSVLEEGNGRNISKVIYLKKSSKDPKYYSLIARLGSNTDGGKGFVEHKNTLFKLFLKAYFPIDPQFIRVESVNLSRYFSPADPHEFEKWAVDNLYTIEIVGETFESRQFMLRQALKEYFDYIDVIQEKRELKCMVLQRTSSQDKLKTKYPSNPFDSKSSFLPLSINVKNCPFNFFFERLKSDNSYNLPNPMPLMDETGYKGNIDLVLKNPKNLKELNPQLAKYDLRFVEDDRMVDVLVIKEK